MRTLVVDDNPTNLRFVSQMLANWNVPTQVAPSAEIGYDLLAAAARQALPFDLLLLDGHMAEIDGLMMAATIRKESLFDRLKIIMLTSADLLNDMERF